jgi:hypothetical protein
MSSLILLRRELRGLRPGIGPRCPPPLNNAWDVASTALISRTCDEPADQNLDAALRHWFRLSQT